MEIWKDIPDYEGLYQISNYGRILSLDRFVDKYHHVLEKYLEQTINPKGYNTVILSKDGIPKRFEVQRLMGITFFGLNIPCVNHIDGNVLNNNLTNLEPTTYSENSNHAVDVLNAHKRTRNVILENLITKEVKRFNSMSKAEKYLGKPLYWLKERRKIRGNEFIVGNYKFKISELNEKWEM